MLQRNVAKTQDSKNGKLQEKLPSNKDQTNSSRRSLRLQAKAYLSKPPGYLDLKFAKESDIIDDRFVLFKNFLVLHTRAVPRIFRSSLPATQKQYFKVDYFSFYNSYGLIEISFKLNCYLNPLWIFVLD